MELGVLINGIASSLAANNNIAVILDNPIYTAAVIVLVIAIIYYFSGIASSIRAVFYAFCATSIIIFIYHHRFRASSAQVSKVSEIQSALANPPTLQTSELVPVIQPVYLKPEIK